MPEDPWEPSDPLPAPDGAAAGGAPRWNCPGCGGGLTVTVDRRHLQGEAFWKWAWECSACRAEWTDNGFAEAQTKAAGGGDA